MGGKEMKKKRKEKCEESEIRDGAFRIGGEVWKLNRIPSHLHFNFLQLSKALLSVFLSSLLSVPLPLCHPLLPLSLYSVFLCHSLLLWFTLPPITVGFVLRYSTALRMAQIELKNTFGVIWRSYWLEGVVCQWPQKIVKKPSWRKKNNLIRRGCQLSICPFAFGVYCLWCS